MFGRPELIGQFGAVSSTHWLASGAGAAVLEQGGNAMDAAVAAGFVLQVVEPHSNGLGGDVSIVTYSAESGAVSVLCGQGPMPAVATVDSVRSLGLDHLPGSGLLPATVPGAFGGWLRALGEFGTMRLAPLLKPAIGYAERGYPLPVDAASAIASLAPLFATEWSESGRVFLDGSGAAPAAGSRMRNAALAATLRRISTQAAAASRDRQAQLDAAHRAFYQGFVAEQVDTFVRDSAVLDATGRHHRGFLTGQDMAGFTVTPEPPACIDYRGHTVCKPGPWSQGPVFLQQLALVEGLDLSDMGLDSGAYLHAMTEAAKLAFADRDAWYGDPAVVDVPLDTMLGPDYTRVRTALIGPDAAAAPQPGRPDGRTSFVPRFGNQAPKRIASDWMTQLQSGLPTVVLAATARSGDTCTVVTADRWGNLVAAVPSGGWLKSSPVIAGLGFPLGTRGQTMCLDAGHPNALAPGKRPRTTLSPTVVLRDGGPCMAFGTPGGDRQDQWTLASFVAAVDFGLDLQAATEVPTFHTDHFPSSFAPHSHRPGVLVVEDDYPAATWADLRRRGHRLDVVPKHSMGGRVCMVGMAEGFLRAGAGPRGRQAYAYCR